MVSALDPKWDVSGWARALAHAYGQKSLSAAGTLLFCQNKRISAQDYRDSGKDNSRCNLRDLF
jgi:hypothetical protein